MIYPYVFGLIYPIVLLEKENLKGKFWKGISVFYCTVAILLSIYYIRLDNIAYLKANYQQETATAYYTEVISQIKSTEKYNSNLPVLFYGAAGSMDDSIPILWRFDDIQLQGYSNNMHDFISYYAGKEFWNYIVAILIRNLRIGRRLLQVKIFRRCLVIHAMVP